MIVDGPGLGLMTSGRFERLYGVAGSPARSTALSAHPELGLDWSRGKAAQQLMI